jgi:cytochrome P450
MSAMTRIGMCCAYSAAASTTSRPANPSISEEQNARLVKQDMHWHGVDMKADDWVLLPFPAANRDPEQFDRADEVVIDRKVNKHAAFGLGIHRCVGSHLARMELRVALEVWLQRIPEFTLADPAAVAWSTGQIRGPRQLPLRIG